MSTVLGRFLGVSEQGLFHSAFRCFKLFWVKGSLILSPFFVFVWFLVCCQLQFYSNLFALLFAVFELFFMCGGAGYDVACKVRGVIPGRACWATLFYSARYLILPSFVVVLYLFW